MYDYYSDDIYDDVDDFLAHHGVKGMKWGFRRARKSNKSGKKSSRDRSAKEKAKKGKDYLYDVRRRGLLWSIPVIALTGAGLTGLALGTRRYSKTHKERLAEAVKGVEKSVAKDFEENKRMNEQNLKNINEEFDSIRRNIAAAWWQNQNKKIPPMLTMRK